MKIFRLSLAQYILQHPSSESQVYYIPYLYIFGFSKLVSSNVPSKFSVPGIDNPCNSAIFFAANISPSQKQPNKSLKLNKKVSQTATA